MKLVNLVLPESKPQELRLARSIDLVRPIDSVLGWRVLVRGPAVILISPDGRGHEVARSACWLSWDSGTATDYDKLTNYTSEPLSRTTPALSEAELEAATAPTKAGAR